MEASFLSTILGLAHVDLSLGSVGVGVCVFLAYLAWVRSDNVPARDGNHQLETLPECD